MRLIEITMTIRDDHGKVDATDLAREFEEVLNRYSLQVVSLATEATPMDEFLADWERQIASSVEEK